MQISAAPYIAVEPTKPPVVEPSCAMFCTWAPMPAVLGVAVWAKACPAMAIDAKAPTHRRGQRRTSRSVRG